MLPETPVSMETALAITRWLVLLALLAAGGWVSYQAALISDAQRRHRDRAARPSSIGTMPRRDRFFDIGAL